METINVHKPAIYILASIGVGFLVLGIILNKDVTLGYGLGLILSVLVLFTIDYVNNIKIND